MLYLIGSQDQIANGINLRQLKLLVTSQILHWLLVEENVVHNQSSFVFFTCVTHGLIVIEELLNQFSEGFGALDVFVSGRIDVEDQMEARIELDQLPCRILFDLI